MGMSDLAIEERNNAVENPGKVLNLIEKDHHLTPEMMYEGWGVAAISSLNAANLDEDDLKGIVEACMLLWAFPGQNHGVTDILIAQDLQGRFELHWNWCADPVLALDVCRHDALEMAVS